MVSTSLAVQGSTVWGPVLTAGPDPASMPLMRRRWQFCRMSNIRTETTLILILIFKDCIRFTTSFFSLKTTWRRVKVKPYTCDQAFHDVLLSALETNNAPSWEADSNQTTLQRLFFLAKSFKWKNYWETRYVSKIMICSDSLNKIEVRTWHASFKFYNSHYFVHVVVYT